MPTLRVMLVSNINLLKVLGSYFPTLSLVGCDKSKSLTLFCCIDEHVLQAITHSGITSSGTQLSLPLSFSCSTPHLAWQFPLGQMWQYCRGRILFPLWSTCVRPPEIPHSWLVWLSGLSASLWSERSPVQSPIRAHDWVAGPGPQLGACRGNWSMYLLHIDVSLPLFLPHFL